VLPRVGEHGSEPVERLVEHRVGQLDHARRPVATDQFGDQRREPGVLAGVDHRVPNVENLAAVTAVRIRRDADRVGRRRPPGRAGDEGRDVGTEIVKGSCHE
jgi:hypothetical protein